MAPPENKNLIALFERLLPAETAHTPTPGVTLFRVAESFQRTPISYQPEIIILLQGEKYVYLGDELYQYNASKYLVVPVPLPAECEGRIEPGAAILGLAIAIDAIELGEIVLNMGSAAAEPPPTILPRGIFEAQMTAPMHDAITRLLQSLAQPDDADARVLAPMIKREILYRALRGENGEILRALAGRNRRFFQIAKVLRQFHESYNQAFDMEALARDLDMSSSTFHSSFKSVTNTSPLQYIKQVRLHKARTLMLQNGLNANVAAMEVGYESASQFSREYKRFFGVPPATDVAGVVGSGEAGLAEREAVGS